jgi:hypothetical protein
MGGSATRSVEKAEDASGEGLQDDDDDGDDDDDDDEKTPFGFYGITFWLTYFARERLPFYSVASDPPPPKGPIPSADMSPAFLKGQAAAEKSKTESKKAGTDVGVGKAPLLDHKTQAMQVAADNSKVTAAATQELARAATFRLRQDAASAMVTRLGDDIKEALADLAELEDEGEKEAKRKEIGDLKIEREQAKKRQKTIIEESMQPTNPVLSLPAPTATMIPPPSPLRIQMDSAAATLTFTPDNTTV